MVKIGPELPKLSQK